MMQALAGRLQRIWYFISHSGCDFPEIYIRFCCQYITSGISVWCVWLSFLLACRAARTGERRTPRRMYEGYSGCELCVLSSAGG